MDFLAQLNPEQRQAAEHVNGPLLILAGAGSGKTRVIVHRIAHLLAARHARPEELLAVTFTNKAAEEMRSRVESLLGGDCSALWMSTFHSLCARLLRREAPAIGLTRDFVIYDSSDQLTMMKQVLRDLQIDDGILQPRAALSRISHAKNTMEGVDAIRDSAWRASGSLRGEQLVKVYDRYTAALRASNALDFDDLLLKTVELFETVTSVRERYADRFRFVMVDEYQDTNRPQYLLIRRLSERYRNLCVVGDPDQSIYKWRGADLRNILDFEQDFSDAVVVRLEQNYRSTQTILDAATAVISQNRNRKPKRLWTDRQGGSKITYFRGVDDLDEAAFITRVARSALGEDLESVVAVLYRTNAQSRVIEDSLMREGVSYRIVGGVRFYERKEIKDTLAYLKLILNPHDDVSLRRVINVPTRGIGKGVMDSVERVAVEAAGSATPLLSAGLDNDSARSLWARIGRAIDQHLLPARATASLKVFQDLILALTDMARRETVSIALGKTLDQTGYLRDLREEHTEEAQGRIDNLMELVSAAREYETREPEPSLAGFVDRLSLLSEVDEEAGARNARVWLMTMHAAKGLEFPVVVIAGLEEGLFPHSRASDDEAELDEERRLCYVAMTRARTRLVLTGAARRRVFGEYQGSDPSRFVDEVPAELVERVESTAVSSSYQRSFAYSGMRATPYPRERNRSLREEPAFKYEDENQSAMFPVRVGARVRHAQFGVGTVISVEELSDDLKVVVRFSVGSKTLRARYAKLEPA
ncbi:MAG TPA: UvrD-helicase domain-containing protein [Vicinamibacterales bacterium]|jgi:DNA helicase-2/ATP-dependent DNA helicase PcrA